jgi:hypothetical protein
MRQESASADESISGRVSRSARAIALNDRLGDDLSRHGADWLAIHMF